MSGEWLDWVVATAWQTALLAAAVTLADLALARFGFARLRHALWLLVLAKFLLPPDLAAAWAPVTALRPTDVASAGGAAPADAASWPAKTAFFVWLAGAAVVAAVAVARTRALGRRIREGAVEGPLPARTAAALDEALRRIGVRRPRRVVRTSAVASPALVGWFRPTLVLPLGDDGSLRHALLHEMAHLRRGDLLVAAVATLVRCVHWHHPAAWLAAGRLAVLREVCSDLDAAAVLGAEAGSYRGTLASAARRLAGAPAPALGWLGAHGWLGAASALCARLDALSRPVRPRSAASRCAGTGVVLAAAACALPMGPGVDAATNRSPTPDPFTVADARALLARSPATDADAPGCLQRQLALVRIAAEFSAADGAPRRETSDRDAMEEGPR